MFAQAALEALEESNIEARDLKALFVGNEVGIDPDQADMDLIGKEVSIGYQLLPPNDAEGGVEGVAFTFT